MGGPLSILIDASARRLALRILAVFQVKLRIIFQKAILIGLLIKSKLPVISSLLGKKVIFRHSYPKEKTKLKKSYVKQFYSYFLRDELLSHLLKLQNWKPFLLPLGEREWCCFSLF